MHLGAPDRTTPRFIRTWNDEVHRLAEQGLDALVEVAGNGRMQAMRRAARRSAERYSPGHATIWWDDFYDRACNGVVLAP
jgi:hypothetical protein